MTNNRISPARQYEAKRDPDHPKICARCQLVWREYSPARDPHCHCFDHEYADFDREFGDFWRRKSDKEVARLSEHCACNTTHWMCPCQQERMAKLERLVKDAEHYVTMIAFPRNGDWWPGAPEWLARYREMFPEGT